MVQPTARQDIQLPAALESHPLYQAGIIHTLQPSWSYLAGIIDADGSILMYVAGRDGALTATCVLAQSNPAFLSAVHWWLLDQNIFTTIYALPSQATEGTGKYSYGSGVHILKVCLSCLHSAQTMIASLHMAGTQCVQVWR